jgi:hypothetical protein
MTASSRSAQVKRELLLLVGLVLVLDGLFVTAYFVGRLSHASVETRLIFTLVWTGGVLLLAVRGLSRVRRLRLQSPGQETPR